MGNTNTQNTFIDALLLWLEAHFDDSYHVMRTPVTLTFEHNTSRVAMLSMLREERVPEPSFKGNVLINTPDLVIQVDTSEELSDISNPLEYYISQTQDLMDIGVQKVLWVLSLTEKVIIADSGKRWVIADWAEDIEVLHGISLNLRKILNT